MQTIIESLNDKLRKQINIKSVVISSTILLASVAAIILTNRHLSDTTSALYMAAITVSIVLFIWSLIKLLVSNKHWVFATTKSPIKSYMLFFKTDKLDNLIVDIEARNFEKLAEMAGDRNAGARLDVVISKDCNFAACQIMKYVPYHYEQVTEVVEIPREKLELFTDRIQSILKIQ